MAIGDNSENNSNFAKQNNEENDLRRRNRQVLSERFSPEELKGCYGRVEEAEGLLQRGDASSVPEIKTEKTGDVELGKIQENILEEWAKNKKIWIENTTETLKRLYGKPFAEEGEATVYRKNANTVVKAISLAYYIEPHLLLDRVVLHNSLFPETSITVTQFGRKQNGDFVIIAEQNFIEGEAVTQDEIVKFMAKLGFTPYSKNKTDFINEVTGIIIDDLHDENVIKKGKFLYVIDGDFRINTANYGLNGTRTTKGNNPQLRLNFPTQQFTTSQGEVYGFLDKSGNMFLDETVINPEHPIHEYTHMWDRMVAQKNPRLWKQGVSLMQQLALWNQIAKSENYGKKWVSQGIKGERLINLIASEVHSKLTK